MTRRALAPLVALVLLGLALAWSQARGVQGPSQRPPLPRQASPAPRPTPAPVDLGRLRDVFRFADEDAQADASEDHTDARPAPVPLVAPPPPPGPRLVGIVWRGGQRRAALSLDGEVELAGEREQAAGVTVLWVGDESVRVRRPDGSEELLQLP